MKQQRFIRRSTRGEVGQDAQAITQIDNDESDEKANDNDEEGDDDLDGKGYAGS